MKALLMILAGLAILAFALTIVGLSQAILEGYHERQDYCSTNPGVHMPSCN